MLRAVLDEDRAQQADRVSKGEQARVGELDLVLLAGGASKMPQIRALVYGVTRREPLIHRSLENVVVIGAAYEAANMGRSLAKAVPCLPTVRSRTVLLDDLDTIDSSRAREEMEKRAIQRALEQAAKELGTEPSALYRWLKYPITQGESQYPEPVQLETRPASFGNEHDVPGRQGQPGEPIRNEPSCDSNLTDHIPQPVGESTEQQETAGLEGGPVTSPELLEFQKFEPVEMQPEVLKFELEPIVIVGRAEIQEVKPQSIELKVLNVERTPLGNFTGAIHAVPIQPIEVTTEAPNGLDHVQFSVTAPPKVKPRAKFLVDIWAHLEAEYARIIELARDSAPAESIQIRSVDPVPLSRGTSLSVQLAIEGMTVEPEHNTILWEGKIGRATFLVSAPFRLWSRTSAGSARIYVSGLEIARIQFVVKTGWRSVKPGRIPCRIEQHRKAFASYSSEDRDQVLARIQGLQKGLPSLEVFLDVLKLRSGQDWQQQLWNVIPTHDVFYLFWSANASSSEWVEKEWRCALKTRGLDFIDPVPLCTPEQAPPPTELAGKHFNDWVLAFMRNQPSGGR
jgi:TIR domain